MRRFAGLSLIMGLIVLCIFTARLRGRLLTASERVEAAMHEAIVLQEEIDNTRALTDRRTSVARLAEIIAWLSGRGREFMARADTPEVVR